MRWRLEVVDSMCYIARRQAQETDAFTHSGQGLSVSLFRRSMQPCVYAAAKHQAHAVAVI